MIFKNVLQKFENWLIDSLIGDDPYDLSDGSYMGEKLNRNTKKIDMNNTCCNECKFCLKVLAPTYPPTWNIKCSHPIGDIIIPSGRIIKFRAESDDIVEKPSWCPIIVDGDKSDKPHETETSKEGNEATASSPKTDLKRPKRWSGTTRPNSWVIEERLKKLKPRLSLEDIKVGDIVHLPPTPTEGRMDVVITHRYVYSASGTVIGNDQKTVYLYSSGLNSCIMSRRKKEDIEV